MTYEESISILQKSNDPIKVRLILKYHLFVIKLKPKLNILFCSIEIILED